MRRYGLLDDQWAHIEPLLPGRVGYVGGTARDSRLFVDAVLDRYRAGILWRDLPERFGGWKHTHTRFSRWAKSGVWERVFTALSADALATRYDKTASPDAGVTDASRGSRTAASPGRGS